MLVHLKQVEIFLVELMYFGRSQTWGNFFWVEPMYFGRSKIIGNFFVRTYALW